MALGSALRACSLARRWEEALQLPRRIRFAGREFSKSRSNLKEAAVYHRTFSVFEQTTLSSLINSILVNLHPVRRGILWLTLPSWTPVLGLLGFQHHNSPRTVVLFASNLLLSNQLKLPVYPLETGDQAHAETLKLNRSSVQQRQELNVQSYMPQTWLKRVEERHRITLAI